MQSQNPCKPSGKIHHGGTEFTEKSKILFLRVLRDSVLRFSGGVSPGSSRKYLVIAVLFLFSIIATWNFAADPDWCRHLPRAGFSKLERIKVPSEWFEVYQVRPGIFAIAEPRQFEEVISYLIIGSKSSLLFDSGMGIVPIRPIVESLTKTPVMVLNSHTHPDHIGGNHEFQTVLSVDTQFTHTNSRGYSDPEMKAWVGPENICGELPEGFRAQDYTVRPFRVSRHIRDGEVLDLGDHKVEIMLTPGHTPDALCLLDRQNKVLFTGDTFYSGPIYLYSPETNFDDYTKSIRRLVALKDQINVLLTAHNSPESPSSELERLNEAVEKIRNGEMKPMEKDGLHEFFFQGFSILMKKK